MTADTAQKSPTTRPYRRYGEYVVSDCDRWNADDREEDDDER